MGGPTCIPVRRSNREAAGVDGGETLEVRLDLDTDKREVKPPADFIKALKAAHPAWHRWLELSYSHQCEYGWVKHGGGAMTVRPLASVMRKKAWTELLTRIRAPMFDTVPDRSGQECDS